MLTISFLLWGSIDARPAGWRKIQFSPITNIIGLPVEFSDKAAPSEGTDEYLEGLRLVMVTKDGYEYTGSLEEVERLFYTKEHNDGEIPTQPQDEQLPTHTDISKVLEKSLEKLAEKRSVIGPDQRQRQVPNRFPFTAIGRIVLGCTGTFVAPKTVLTAGHCVHGSSGWYDKLDVLRAKDCDPNQGIKHVWKTAVTINAWITNPRPENDIGWIIVNTPSPVSMSFTYMTPPAVSTTIYIYGYPADLPKWCLYGTNCPLAIVEDKRLRYTCDTYGGNSGSGVYYNRNGVNTIIGVHAYGVYQGTNSGTRMTKSYYDTTIYVIKKYGA